MRVNSRPTLASPRTTDIQPELPEVDGSMFEALHEELYCPTVDAEKIHWLGKAGPAIKSVSSLPPASKVTGSVFLIKAISSPLES